MRARVYNDHTEEHVEQFKGETLRIPPGKFIEMTWTSAVQFRGQYSPIQRDGMGRDLKPKKIRIEKIETKSAAPEPVKFICQQDGRSFDTQKQLDEYIADNYEVIVDDADQQTKMKRKRQ